RVDCGPVKDRGGGLPPLLLIFFGPKQGTPGENLLPTKANDAGDGRVFGGFEDRNFTVKVFSYMSKSGIYSIPDKQVLR
ncbi:MAG: hypothetical protein KAJ19_26285, partial [Gammaproteobacteria bacterium]|nr:hypothetical protein [Gammaproteobacteria bacterium]